MVVLGIDKLGSSAFSFGITFPFTRFTLQYNTTKFLVTRNSGENGNKLGNRSREIRNSSNKHKKKKVSKEQRNFGHDLITVSRTDGNWTDAWQSQQFTNLSDLGLQELAEEGFVGDGLVRKDKVTVLLNVSKTGLGFYVKGLAKASVLRVCDRCFKLYSNPCSAPFEVWLAPKKDPVPHNRREAEDNGDPSIFYFPESYNIADLTDTVREAIQLSQSDKAFCSNICANTKARSWEYETTPKTTVSSIWLPLLNAKSKVSEETNSE